MEATITRLKEAGIGYKLARSYVENEMAEGTVDASGLVDFEILWPQLHHIKPLKGRWVPDEPYA